MDIKMTKSRNSEDTLNSFLNPITLEYVNSINNDTLSDMYHLFSTAKSRDEIMIFFENIKTDIFPQLDEKYTFKTIKAELIDKHIEKILKKIEKQ